MPAISCDEQKDNLTSQRHCSRKLSDAHHASDYISLSVAGQSLAHHQMLQHPAGQVSAC